MMKLDNLDDLLNINNELKNIYQTDSLTKIFKEKFSLLFSVEVISMTIASILADEQEYLHEYGFKKQTEEVYIREVFLKLGDYKVVKARSICNTSSIDWMKILNRGNLPLGEYLFEKEHNIKRTNFKYLFDRDKKLLTRKSIFINKNNEYLLLTESFLPNLSLCLDKLK